MPLKKGHSPEVVSHNIKEMMKAGHPQKQAIAASMANARKYKKMSHGGDVATMGVRGTKGMAEGGMVGSSEEYDDNEKPLNMMMAEGGMVGSPEEYDDNEKPMVTYKGHGAMRTPPKMESMDEMDDLGADSEQRDLNEIRMEGEYYPAEVANPNEMEEASMFAKALKKKASMAMSPENPEGETGMEYAMGGLVQGMADTPVGNKPDEDMDSSSKEDMMKEPMDGPGPLEHPVMNDPMGPGLSAEAKAAILAKKKGRRFVRS